MFSKVLSRQNRALLRELVATDFKLRYQGSLLGYLWTLLKPLGIFAILYIVFVKFFKFGKGIDNFPVYLLLGIVLWGFFTEATSNGMQAIVSRGELLRKIKFPRYMVVVSGTVSALVNLAFNLFVVFIFMLFTGVELSFSGFFWFGLLLVELFVFSLALAFFLGAAYVKYRDLSHIWEIFLQGAFYLTPILYPLQLVIEQSEMVASLLLISPVAQIIQDSREAIITPDTITLHELVAFPLNLVPFILVGASIYLATNYFRRSSKYFAENI